jgi:methylamine dehydrogenase heavy chain
MAKHARWRVAVVMAGALGLTLASAATTARAADEEPAFGTQEDHPTRVLSTPQPHWVYVLDPASITSKIWILDGDSLELKGTVDAGYSPNLVLSHDANAFYVTETFWSRGTRGDRTDVVTAYDPKTLSPTAEVILPAGRILIVPKKHDAQLTTDGRYLVSLNMNPGFSLSVVDVKENRYVGEVETGGCGLVFPTGAASVASLCPDGSFAHITFDGAGGARVEDGEPFFDAENEPVFEHAALHRPTGRGLFVSYDGWVYPVELNGRPRVGQRWRLQGQGEEDWRPGGWQVAAYHAPTNRLFVLMHEGGRWTHKQAGEEVWVFDAASGRRLERVELDEEADCLGVTSDDQPLLFASSEEEASVQVYDATSYEHQDTKEDLGDSPCVLYTFGE